MAFGHYHGSSIGWGCSAVQHSKFWLLSSAALVVCVSLLVGQLRQGLQYSEEIKNPAAGRGLAGERP
jgi:hypothetical protein